MLQSVDRVPRRAKKSPDNIIALGEATNHAHILDGGQTAIYTFNESFWNKDAIPTIFIEIKKDTILRHINISTGKQADHAPVELPPGIYKVIHQVEMNPFDRKLRLVLD
ncbi:MAG: hypothetical protein GX465_16775 [Acidobacteria bacterium]|nr:hypothetical protein [Acidobacteriota bacterium]